MKAFKVYKSSAGSGKTYTLVQEYLMLCLADDSPFYFAHILAITFTNKAAEEMKSRVIKALKQISKKESKEEISDLKANLIETLKLSQEQLEQRAAACLTAIMHNYADFNISTIDKFSHRLIRTFAKDLGLSMNFKVDLQLDLILEDLVQEFVQKVGEDDKISQALIAHSRSKMLSGKAWDPRKELLELSKASLDESAINYLKASEKLGLEGLLSIQNSLINKNRELKKNLAQIGGKAKGLIEKESIPEGAFYGGKNGLPGYFNKLIAFNYKAFQSISFCLTTVEKDKWSSGKAKEEDKLKISQIKEQLTELFWQGKELVDLEMPKYIARSAVIKYLGMLGLLGKIEKVYSSIKKENRILPISDFNKKIAEVVLAEPMPFIYERLGERYNHILIDEFQDTSIMQFMNLLPLIEESLARGHKNLIVGDAKQAIYRFRGGEVEQFSEMPNYVPHELAHNPLVVERLQNLKNQYDESQLNTNYRSLSKVVEFNNRFFKNLLVDMPERVSRIFDGHEQKTKAGQEGGYVEVKFLEKEEEQQEEQCYQDINSCIEDGFNYQDITILCRTKKEAGLIAEYLSAREIPLISSESLLLKSSPRVQFLLEMAKHIYNPEELSIKTHIIEFLFLFNRLEGNIHQTLEKLILEKGNFEIFLRKCGIELDYSLLNSLSLFECFESLIRQLDLQAEYDVYLQFFMEQVFLFSNRESNSLADFFAWWDANDEKLSIDLPAGINAVQIMTLHKSKGLEFPVVIYPFIKPPKAKTDLIWAESSEVHPDLSFTLIEHKEDLRETIYLDDFMLEQERRQMDLMNLNYVAFTRAVERLYLRSEVLPKSSYSVEKENLSLPHLLQRGKPEGAIDMDEGYAFGIKEKKKSKEESNLEAEEIALSFHSEPWRNKLKISTEQAGKFTFDQERSARNYGNLFHEIMSHVDELKDIDPVLERYCQKGEILNEEKDELKKKIVLLMEDTIGQQFFGSGLAVKKEASLWDSSGEVLRPDRVVFQNDKVMVLDYKTGLINESHKKQMQKYRDSIKETTDKPVEAYLYYLEQDFMHALP